MLLKNAKNFRMLFFGEMCRNHAFHEIGHFEEEATILVDTSHGTGKEASS